MQHLITPNISESRHSLVAHVSAFQSNKDCDDSDTSTTGDVSYTSIHTYAILRVLISPRNPLTPPKKLEPGLFWTPPEHSEMFVLQKKNLQTPSSKRMMHLGGYTGSKQMKLRNSSWTLISVLVIYAIPSAKVVSHYRIIQSPENVVAPLMMVGFMTRMNHRY